MKWLAGRFTGGLTRVVLILSVVLIGTAGGPAAATHVSGDATTAVERGPGDRIEVDLHQAADTLRLSTAGRALLQAPAARSALTPVADEEILYSVADTFVEKGHPSRNNGSLSWMNVGYEADPQTSRSLVQFNIASLSSGQEIAQATLWLWRRGSMDSPSTSRTIRTYRAASSWTESSVTWNSQPAVAEAYGASSVPPGSSGWYAFDVTELVQAWYDGTYSNHGIVLRGPEASGDNWVRQFSTRENEYVPELIVAYGAANSPPYQPHEPTPADGATNQPVGVSLSWTGGDPDPGDAVTYDVYVEANDSTPDDLICGDVSSPTCDPGTLAYDTHYYWYVVATDNHGATTTGDTWDFTTTVGYGPRIWSGAISSDWHTPGNWTPAAVPTSGDDVTIPNVANHPIIASGDAQANNLTIQEGAVLDMTDRVLTVQGTLTNNGTLRQTRSVTEGTNTEFLRITNLAGTHTKYWGVDISPSSIAGSDSLAEPAVGSARSLEGSVRHKRAGVRSACSDEPTPQEARMSALRAEGLASQADEDVFYSIADADILEGYASYNFGGDTQMWAGYDGGVLDPPGQIARSLVRFTIAGLPPGQEITEATLWLYVEGSWDMPDTSRTIRTYRATSAWSESSVTWNNKPGLGEAYGSRSIFHEGVESWYEFDVTDLLRAWYEGTYSNHGIILRADQESVWGFRAFGTREGDFAPELVVAYAATPSNRPPHQPHNPTPADGATDQSVYVDLSWTGGDPDAGDMVTYDVYLEANDSSPDDLICDDVSTQACDPGTLDYGKHYYWKVIARDEHGATTAGPVWDFTTGEAPNNPPNEPSAPSPADGAAEVSIDADLSWTGGDPDPGDTVTYDVYLEANDSTPNDLICDDVSTPACDPGTLDYDEHYYWKVIARDEHGETTAGPVWDFTTGEAPNNPPNAPSNPSPADGETEVSTSANLSWTGGDPDPGDTVTYDVYLGANDSTPDDLICDDVSTPACDPGTLDYGEHYYWKVIARDEQGETTAGPVWDFTTETGGTRVTVSVSGNQLCPGRDTGVKRCFDIAPEGEMDASVRFYFTEAERNGQTVEDLLVFHDNGGWTEEPGPYTHGGAGDAQYVEAQNVDDFSIFALDTLDTGPAHAVFLPLVARRWPPIPDVPVLNPISNPGGGGDYDVRWNAAYLANTYLLEEADNSSFASPATVYSGSGTYWNASGKGPGTYYYRVKARSAWGDSGWSSIRSVTVRAVEQFARPGLWTGTYDSSFRVTTDNRVRDFSVTLPIPRPEGGECEINLSEEVPIEDGHFSLGIVQGAFKFVDGDFDTSTAVTGVFHSVACQSQIWFYDPPLDWEASWKQP